MPVIAIALATLSSIVVGTIWYRPALFGGPFRRITGIDPNSPPRKALVYALSTLGSAITATVLWVATSAAHGQLGGARVLVALALAVLGWLGFTATRTLIHALFGQGSLRVWAINAGYELTTVLLMAVIVGLLP